MPNRRLTGKSRLSFVTHHSQARSHRISTMSKPHAGFARWSYGGDTVHARRATVMPWNKPALFRSQVSPGAISRERRFSTVYLDSMRCLQASLRCGPGEPRCPHGSDAGTENRDSVNEAISNHSIHPLPVFKGLVWDAVLKCIFQIVCAW